MQNIMKIALQSPSPEHENTTEILLIAFDSFDSHNAHFTLTVNTILISFLEVQGCFKNVLMLYSSF